MPLINLINLIDANFVMENIIISGLFGSGHAINSFTSDVFINNMSFLDTDLATANKGMIQIRQSDIVKLYGISAELSSMLLSI